MTDQPVMLVNTIEVVPERQPSLLDLLLEAFENVVRHRPGFVSGTVLVSLDGTSVVSCAVWRRREDIEATRRDPASIAYAARLAEIASPRPTVYRIVAEVGRGQTCTPR